ncbi:tail protein [Ectopseudomonas composti]|jgi:microcystin-dependent protein|uniref:Tail protein n=1 Tax=Ectopseudomonas composti TaxID=658457 RepID=A0ABN0S5B9_9GAMM|nr:tail fiber protein [Pseudomonas composti]EZH76258.1 tail protein [Pseudomonas composti]
MSDPFLGEIRMVGFNFAPRGWATCQGQIMAITQNSALFALLGTIYGGNGQSTFGLPNFSGRSPVGQGNGPGLTPVTIGEMAGSENITMTTNQMPMHTHGATASAPTGTAQVAIPAATTGTTQATPSTGTVLGPIAAAGRAGTLYCTGAADSTLAPFNSTVNVQAPTVTVATAGGSQPVPLRNPYLGTNFIIALEGIFPSRN